jgi:hypothetical protein
MKHSNDTIPWKPYTPPKHGKKVRKPIPWRKKASAGNKIVEDGSDDSVVCVIIDDGMEKPSIQKETKQYQKNKHKSQDKKSTPNKQTAINSIANTSNNKNTNNTSNSNAKDNSTSNISSSNVTGNHVSETQEILLSSLDTLIDTDDDDILDSTVPCVDEQYEPVTQEFSDRICKPFDMLPPCEEQNQQVKPQEGMYVTENDMFCYKPFIVHKIVSDHTVLLAELEPNDLLYKHYPEYSVWCTRGLDNQEQAKYWNTTTRLVSHHWNSPSLIYGYAALTRKQ